MVDGFLYEVGNHFRIGFGTKSVAPLLQFYAQLFPILNNPVVDDGDFTGTVQMGMGVGVGYSPVGRPTGMSHPRISGGTTIY